MSPPPPKPGSSGAGGQSARRGLSRDGIETQVAKSPHSRAALAPLEQAPKAQLDDLPDLARTTVSALRERREEDRMVRISFAPDVARSTRYELGELRGRSATPEPLPCGARRGPLPDGEPLRHSAALARVPVEAPDEEADSVVEVATPPQSPRQSPPAGLVATPFRYG